MSSKTVQLPRMPRRPETGLLAWLATIGYISAVFSPDATLSMMAIPNGADVRWRVGVQFGHTRAAVEDMPTLAAALRDLWPALEAEFHVYQSGYEDTRKPVNYADDRWLDDDTQRTLDLLLEITHTVFKGDWALVILYQAVETPAERVKMRLIAHATSIQVGGQGPSLREACRDLYRNAAPEYFHSSGRLAEGVLT